MYTVTFLLSSLLSLSVAATSVAQAPAPPARSPDACGPAVQQPSDPQDTCNTAPSSTSSTTGFTIGGMTGGGLLATFDWTICAPLVNTICDTMADPSTVGANWYFKTSQVFLDYGSPACQMGFWLPSDPLAATRPGPDQCKRVFSSLVSAAQNSNWRWYGATINLSVNPANGQGQWAMPGGSGTGAQVNAGYPSYILQVQQNNGPDTDLPSGQGINCEDPYTDGC